MRLLKSTLPLLLLALLPALFLWKLTLAGRILVGLDPFNFFYPYHDAVAAALRAGRLPEWNPALFGGVPFLADSQAQLFYPLAWPFRFLSAPTALSAGIVLHLSLAGVGTWAWARYGVGLGAWGAWAAGALVALGGYLGAQVEHLNQLQAVAWLPWLLLGYEWGRTSRRGVALGALALGMSLLAGHAQTTFISLALLALWALRSAVRDDERTRADVLTVQRSGLTAPIVRAAWGDFLRVNLVPLLAIGLIGGLLAAVQLVPTQALSALSTRAGGLSFREAAAFSFDPRLLPRALLPTFGQDARLLSEYVAWVGFTGLLLALVGAVGLPRFLGIALAPPPRAARDFGLLASVTGLLLALGGYNPLFWFLWRLVPGFDLFRAPARWLLLWALGAAVLAGVGLERLMNGRRTKDEGRGTTNEGRRWGWAGIGVLGLVALLGIVGDWPERGALLGWGLAGAAALGLVALRRVWAQGRGAYGLVALGLLLAELGAASWGLDYQKATAPEAYGGLRPTPAHLLTTQPALGGGRLLSLSDLTWDPGDLATLQTRHAGLLGEEASYDLVVATKLKEVLAPNQPMRWGLPTADGYGGGLLPSARWVAFQETLPLAKVVPDGRLREQLVTLPRPALLDVMGVSRLVADKVGDWWSTDVFHDLGVVRPLAAGETLRWEVPGGTWQATGLSFVVIGAWPDRPGNLTLGGRTLPLSDAQERATRETERGTERHLWLPMDPPITFEDLSITAGEGWTLGGLSLVDERLPAFEPLPADPTIRTTFSGDVKVYERRAALGRAWVVPRGVAVVGVEAAATFVSEPGFDPRQTVILEGHPTEQLASGGLGTVTWLRDEAGALDLRVSVPEGGWLVVADTPFPGWEVRVDGQKVPWNAANVLNRAIFLAPGEYEVAWRYRTPGLQLGLIGTLVGVVALAAWLVWPASVRR